MTKRKSRGFTLIELIVTIAIVAIVALLGVPGMNALLRDMSARADSNTLLSSITLARSEAIKRGSWIWVSPLNNADWQAGWAVWLDDGDHSFNSSKDTQLRHFDAIESIIHTAPSRLAIAADGSLAVPTSSTDFSLSPSGCQNDEQRSLHIAVSGRASLSRVTCGS